LSQQPTAAFFRPLPWKAASLELAFLSPFSFFHAFGKMSQICPLLFFPFLPPFSSRGVDEDLSRLFSFE